MILWEICRRKGLKSEHYAFNIWHSHLLTCSENRIHLESRQQCCSYPVINAKRVSKHTKTFLSGPRRKPKEPLRMKSVKQKQTVPSTRANISGNVNVSTATTTHLSENLERLAKCLQYVFFLFGTGTAKQRKHAFAKHYHT